MKWGQQHIGNFVVQKKYGCSYFQPKQDYPTTRMQLISLANAIYINFHNQLIIEIHFPNHNVCDWV